MPISHQYKVIFIHIPKTGGSSVDTALGIHGDNNRGSIKPAPEILFGVMGSKALQHLTALEIKKIVPQAVWQNYFKFAFVRNPYDRLISEYFWRQKLNKKFRKVGFKKFLLNFVAPAKNRPLKHFLDDHYRDQYKFITDENEKIMVDFVGKFENFIDDFKKICQSAQLNIKLPHLNKTKHQSYQQYYNEETKKIAAQLCQKDLSIFNYQF